MEYENKIKTMLMNLGVDPALKGFGYLVEGVKFTVEDKKNKKLRPVMKLYNDIAKIYDTTAQRVVRAMNHSKEKAFAQNNKSLYKIFDGLFSEYSGQVAISTFIAVIAEKIIMNEN